MANQVTLNDIAQRVGITRQAVSAVLNKKESFVGKATREKVLKVAHELNYQPNFFAKSIRMGKTRCIGLMGGVTGITFHVPYYSLLATYTERALTELVDDYSLVLFGANHNQTYDKSMELISKGLVDGLVIIVPPMNLEHFDKKVKPQLKKVNLPFVVIHSISRELNFNNVGFNSFQGGYLAGQHLVSLGYKDIGFYLRREENPQQTEIFNGFKKALDEHGIDLPNKSLIYTRDPRKLDHYYRASDTARGV